ncbi:MAG: hypothetical protein AB1689_00215 [Thermodesulfobacteriota bacterium]
MPGLGGALIAHAGCSGDSSQTAAGPGSGPGPDPVPAECAAGEFENTFDALQEVIFDGQGCTRDACHGSATSGGLDLRAGASYGNLFEATSTSSALPRLRPGEPSESYLYLKLAAATRPGSVQVAGSPMPSGLPPIPEEHLEALKIWIEAGAPERGSVGDSIRGDSEYVEDLLGACLPPATPISIEPLEPPPPGEGVQFRMPTYLLPASAEREVCFAQYYDFSGVIPAEYQDPARGVFYVNGSHLRQDPHSHHLVIDHSGLGADRVHDASFGEWTCKGGARDGEACEPTDLDACGEGLCGSRVTDSLACIGYGPPESAVNVAGGGIGGAQTAQQIDRPREGGYYREIPIRGIIYWNSHAFNLTQQDHQLRAYLNMTFARERRFEVEQIVDSHAIYIQAGQAPFTVERYCAEHVLPRHAELLGLSSHTHKRGEHFTVDLPDGTRIYESFDYVDPLDARYEPPLRFDSEDPAERTLTYCADFNNGVDAEGGFDLRRVTRRSTMPDRTSCKPVACVQGRVGEPCAGIDDDAACDSSPSAGDGWCDACPVTAGVTTENEMFVLTGYYAVRPR